MWGGGEPSATNLGVIHRGEHLAGFCVHERTTRGVGIQVLDDLGLSTDRPGDREAGTKRGRRCRLQQTRPLVADRRLHEEPEVCEAEFEVHESSTRGPLDPIGLSLLTYVATILAALTLYGLIAAIPARLLARRPITPQLAYE